MHRTFFRTFTTTAMMVLVSFLLIGAAFGFASRQVFVSEARESMMTNSREISRMAVAYAAEGDLRSLELRMTLSTIGASTNQHIFIVNPSGYIITCSDSAVFCEHIGKRLDESVTAILPQSGTVASLGTLGGFYASEHYTVISALTDGDELLGHLFVSKDTGTALSIWETIVPLFFFISLIVLCLALIFSYASSKYFAKPLRDMADAARRFGRGELSVRVEPTDSTDEIGELTEAFNSMADSLEQSETKRREFIANVSHELKTPMTTISGFADGILDGTIPPESEKKYLQIISSETKRLARLVRSMLELSRLQSGTIPIEKTRVALDDLVYDVCDRYRVIAEEHDLALNIPEDLSDCPTVYANADRVEQMLIILLDNAIKYTERGSVGVSVKWDDEKVVITVRDSGIGIAEEDLPYVFDRFYKVDKAHSGKGSGLGLSIARELLNRMNEQIWVESKKGEGSAFSFTVHREPESEQEQK